MIQLIPMLSVLGHMVPSIIHIPTLLWVGTPFVLSFVSQLVCDSQPWCTDLQVGSAQLYMADTKALANWDARKQVLQAVELLIWSINIEISK